MLTFLENDFTTRGAFAHFDIPTAEGGLELERKSANSRSVSCSEALKLRLTLRAVLHHKCCKEGVHQSTRPFKNVFFYSI
jgi:hypothetical protein